MTFIRYVDALEAEIDAVDADLHEKLSNRQRFRSGDEVTGNVVVLHRGGPHRAPPDQDEGPLRVPIGGNGTINGSYTLAVTMPQPGSAPAAGSYTSVPPGSYSDVVNVVITY